MQRALDRFEAANAQVLGVSCDTVFSHQAFAEKLGGIDFPLLSDFWPHGATAQAYGVFNAERGMANRSVFIIDTEGVVRWKKVYPPGTLPDPDELLEALARL